MGQQIDQTIQNYLRDAHRPFYLKIFKAEIFFKKKKCTVFFTHRFEMSYQGQKGNHSVYSKLETVKNLLNSNNPGQFQNEFEAIKNSKKSDCDTIDELRKDTDGTSNQ